jgi:hypothetical protein
MRLPIFVDLPLLDEIKESTDRHRYLESFSNSMLEKFFFEINVDASLTEEDFVKLLTKLLLLLQKFLIQKLLWLFS